MTAPTAPMPLPAYTDDIRYYSTDLQSSMAQEAGILKAQQEAAGNRCECCGE